MSILFALVILLGCAAEPSSPECTESLVTTSPAVIEEIIKEGRVEVREQDSHAGGGAVTGAIITGATAVATGGIAPAVAVIGGGAVGGYAGDQVGNEQIHTIPITVCRFRIDHNGLPLVYAGGYGDWNEAAFAKCTMFHEGDPVVVQSLRGCYADGLSDRPSYRWISGHTEGDLY